MLQRLCTCLMFFSLTAQADVYINAVGDTMLGSASNPQFLPRENYLKNVIPILRDADLTFGNLEGTMCDQSSKRARCDRSSRNCYLFRMPESQVNDLVEAGFDVMSVANNHIYDFGSECAYETVDTLEDAGITAVGLKTSSGVRGDMETIRYFSSGRQRWPLWRFTLVKVLEG